ncbi:MAG: helix-turn-helix transcriptional regulator [Lysobacteraceae bacterium]
MGTKSPDPIDSAAQALRRLGREIRDRRKALGITAQATAESAGLSRITLHRIEKGEASVSIGAWLNVAAVLGLQPGSLLEAGHRTDTGAPADGWIPARIRLDRYPQLRALAWHVQGTDVLSPVEALAVYERNARHLDQARLSDAERDLIQALRLGLGGTRPDV